MQHKALIMEVQSKVTSFLVNLWMEKRHGHQRLGNYEDDGDTMEGSELTHCRKLDKPSLNTTQRGYHHKSRSVGKNGSRNGLQTKETSTPEPGRAFALSPHSYSVDAQEQGKGRTV